MVYPDALNKGAERFDYNDGVYGKSALGKTSFLKAFDEASQKFTTLRISFVRENGLENEANAKGCNVEYHMSELLDLETAAKALDATNGIGCATWNESGLLSND